MEYISFEFTRFLADLSTKYNAFIFFFFCLIQNDFVHDINIDLT